MATVLQHKVVAALPSPLEPDSIYYVRVGQGFDIHVTNGLGEVVAYGLNAALALQEHIGSGGPAHALATAEAPGFISPAHLQLLDHLGRVNDIGRPGHVGFGVGICPLTYPGMTMLPGTLAAGSPEYGNYQYSDGSVMCWVPAFFYRYGHPDNPTYAEYGVNSVDVLPRSAFPNLVTAGIHGYTLHRAFYDDGVEQPGVFVDKYLCSNNSGVASSIKLGDPLSSNSAHNPFSGLTGSPPNNYSGAIPAAKTRGADFFSSSLFIFKAAALLSLAHAQAATSTAACAWFDPAGVMSFPKGCNNNALRDANDTSVLYVSDGYSNAAKTGSGEPFAKTTHNGQECGIADLNGGMWEICLGLTYLDGNYHILKTDARMADLTPGITLTTDAWGAAGVAANYEVLGPTHGTLGTGPGTNRAVGSASAVLSNATSGLGWAGACAGIPLADGVGGTNLFGNDRFYDNNPTHLCPFAGGHWHYGVSAGVWALSCHYTRTHANHNVGCRAALYLVRRSDSAGGGG